MMLHKSVLLKECIDNLNIKDDGIYIDATIGYAGHASEILKRIPNGFLYGIDQDDYAIRCSEDKLSKIGNNYKIIRDNFVNMKNIMKTLNVDKVDGILFDLGVSSVQLDEDERGFSFHKEAKLDMRMDRSKNFSAYNVVNEYEYKDLVRILRDYGEEKFASSIARNIIKYRENNSIETTLELADIIKNSVPYKARRDGHPARKSFQAIRIEVNHELDVLKEVLDDALSLLNIGGRLCIISFHSLEDRIVKQKFIEYSSIDDKLKKLPFVPDEYKPKYKIISKGIVASDKELNDNYRAHSARLRIIERIGE
ncbi:MAG: 16S rRNA (cytosine(1402)-N(4))-methyltransferase RsmH [Bacilli bacterium]|nr:16S rRNA (cytosine(1402)-N(4))-methyltransferase RsmH [Bacilli bacterium]